MKTLSLDLRQRIVDCYDQGNTTRAQVAQRFCVSLAMVKKLLHQRRSTGDIAPRYNRVGRKRLITLNHQKRITQLLAKHPDSTLKQIRSALGLSCSLTAIHKTLKKMNYSYKKNAARQRTRSPGYKRGSSAMETKPT